MSTGTGQETAVGEVVRRHVPLLQPGEELALDAELRDLGLDSMAAIELLLDLETTFGVEFPDTMLNEENFRTARTLSDAIALLTAAEAAS